MLPPPFLLSVSRILPPWLPISGTWLPLQPVPAACGRPAAAAPGFFAYLSKYLFKSRQKPVSFRIFCKISGFFDITPRPGFSCRGFLFFPCRCSAPLPKLTPGGIPPVFFPLIPAVSPGSVVPLCSVLLTLPPFRKPRKINHSRPLLRFFVHLAFLCEVSPDPAADLRHLAPGSWLLQLLRILLQISRQRIPLQPVPAACGRPGCYSLTIRKTSTPGIIARLDPVSHFI